MRNVFFTVVIVFVNSWISFNCKPCHLRENWNCPYFLSNYQPNSRIYVMAWAGFELFDPWYFKFTTTEIFPMKLMRDLTMVWGTHMVPKNTLVSSWFCYFSQGFDCSLFLSNYKYQTNIQLRTHITFLGWQADRITWRSKISAWTAKKTTPR